MSKHGIKIKNISAAMLYEVNLGVRDYFTYTDALLHNSLFSDYLKKIGMRIHKESTRDIICINFDFGSRSYEDEIKRLKKMLSKANESQVDTLTNVIEKVENNKYKYCKKSHEELRYDFYENNIKVDYKNPDGSIQESIIYRMLYRTSAKAKLGHAVFINIDLYDKAYSWLTMDIDKHLGEKNVKIVELSAYAPLTTSTIVSKVHIPVEDILILKDQESTFKTLTKIVSAEPYEIEKNDCMTYAKKCVVNTVESEVKNVLWDGMGLIDSGSFPDCGNGMILTRNHFFKMCGIKTNIQLFFKDWCKSHNINYDTFMIKDMFGCWHKASDIKVITTDNAIKWKKFIPEMGGTSLAAYQYWKDHINRDGSLWGIVKTDHVSKLGDVQQMSYQMINTLPCSYHDISDIVSDTMLYVIKLKEDDDVFIDFLDFHANAVNHYEMLSALCKHNKKIMRTDWFSNERKKIIANYVLKLRSGKIMVEGDNLTVFGNPYALLLYTVGADYKNDPTFDVEPGTIQCFTTRFPDDAYLAAFRNPHNSPNNVMYLHNHYSPEMMTYFEFSNNILAVNCIQTDIQDRSNGCDFDSDFFFVTNHPTMVNLANYCYQHYPTIVNQLKESGITYDNSRSEYAKMDNKFSKSKLGIGWSSNLALLAVTYYWSELHQPHPDHRKLEMLYDNFVILSVLAQVIIDGCKREYEIDAMNEIKRIQAMDVMTMVYEVNGVQVTKDFPRFMKYTREVPMTKNQKPRNYDDIKRDKDRLNKRINNDLICPMNWLEDFLDTIPNATKRDHIPMSDIFIKMDGKSNHRQMTRILDQIEEYVSKISSLKIQSGDSEDYVECLINELEQVVDSLSKIRITNEVTINRLIETSLSLNIKTGKKTRTDRSSKYTRSIMNLLFKMNKKRFLSNFTQE